jgi:glycosyltransferase involved in cell wall biosynthesis
VKIALVCDWFHPRVGGIELHLNDLAHRLRAAGHDVHVVTPTPGDAVVDGTPVHRIDAPRVPRFGFVYTPGALAKIGATLARESFDVAHCHVSIVAPAAMGGAYQARRLGLPTVLTFHSIVPKTRLLARGVDLALRTSRWRAVFSAVSARVARDVAPLAGKRPVVVLPNGIDAAWWRAPRAPRDPSVLELVTVMRLNPKKRPLALVPLMRQLERLMPEGPRARLSVAGDGPQRGKLERAIARHGLGDRVRVLGRLDRSQIRDLLARSDVFVLPTVRESFGLAALEARCAGLPVVARAESGVAELIEPRVEGLLGRSDADLALQVALLARDTDLRLSIASHNRSTLPPVDWATVVAQHERLYDEAIAFPVPSESTR